MLEAVTNHTPQVIIVDEIGSKEEVQSMSTIGHRGVRLIGTAHGESLTCDQQSGSQSVGGRSALSYSV